MKRSWLIALLAAAGLTALVAGAFALFAPPDVLDAAAGLGDARLWAVLAGLFVLSAIVARLVFVRKRTPEDAVSDPAPAAPAEGGSHLR